MDSSNRRQASLPAQASNPMASRNPMATHGGSVNTRGGSHAQGDHHGLPAPGPGLQRQQLLSSSVRAPPSVGSHSSRKENRVLPIGGPVHISHRGSVAAPAAAESQHQHQQQQRPHDSHQAPNRASLLRRQAEIDEEIGDPGGIDVPQQFYTHDHSNRNESAQPRRHSKGHSAGHTQHRLSSSHEHHAHEPLGQRNSGDSHHSSGHGHHGHGHKLVHQDSRPDKQKERERQHMEDAMLKRAREKQIELIKREIRKEKRVMLTFSLISFFFGILWFIAVCISYWYYVYADEETLQNIIKAYSTQMPPPAVRSGVGHGGMGIGDLIKSAVNGSIATGPRAPKPTKPSVDIDTNDLFVSCHVGIWRVCRTKRYLRSGNEKILCYWHNMFPTDQELRTVQYTDEYIVDYQRTEASFAVLSLLIMAMVVPAALYTLSNTGYMFKRLAAGLYLLSSVTILVIMEVTLTKIEHERQTKPYLRPPKSTVSYGFCFYIGWLMFSVNLITGFVYLMYSRKRKGDKALDDDDESQEILGR